MVVKQELSTKFQIQLIAEPEDPVVDCGGLFGKILLIIKAGS